MCNAITKITSLKNKTKKNYLKISTMLGTYRIKFRFRDFRYIELLYRATLTITLIVH